MLLPFKILLVFHLVSLSWVFFRAPDFVEAWHFLERLAAFPWLLLPDLLGSLSWLYFLLLAFDLPAYLAGKQGEEVLLRLPFPLRGLLQGSLVVAIALFWFQDAPATFIYFQF